jgi:hypothetical protein
VRKVLPLCLIVVSVLAISCATESRSTSVERVGGPRLNVPVPCEEYPNDPECVPGGGGGGGGGGGMPTCASQAVITVGSATTVSDTSLAVTLTGPYSISSCTGPAIWRASVQGTAITPYYYWYVAQCTGTNNFCGYDTNFVKADSGLGLDTLAVVLGSNVRAQFTFALAREGTAPNYKDGVSTAQQTRGPAWGVEPTGAPPFACASTDYPLDRDDQKVDTSTSPPDTFTVRRHYTRNICTGHKKFDTLHVDTIGRGP